MLFSRSELGDSDMKKFLITAGALTVFLAGPCTAADLSAPQRFYAPTPVVIPVFTWTGCYIGANAGGLWIDRQWDDSFPVAPFGPGFGSHKDRGALGGVQGGCNYQRGSWVLGIQGDFDWTGAKGSTT